MSTSVKISREYKEKLDRLQARLYLTTGKKLSLQEVLEILVSLGSDHEEILVEMSQGEKPSITSDDVEAILNTPVDWGQETCEETIDKVLYGEQP
jgi:hypothetical protein